MNDKGPHVNSLAHYYRSALPVYCHIIYLTAQAISRVLYQTSVSLRFIWLAKFSSDKKHKIAKLPTLLRPIFKFLFLNMKIFLRSKF